MPHSLDISVDSESCLRTRLFLQDIGPVDFVVDTGYVGPLIVSPKKLGRPLDTEGMVFCQRVVKTIDGNLPQSGWVSTAHVVNGRLQALLEVFYTNQCDDHVCTLDALRRLFLYTPIVVDVASRQISNLKMSEKHRVSCKRRNGVWMVEATCDDVPGWFMLDSGFAGICALSETFNPCDNAIDTVSGSQKIVNGLGQAAEVATLRCKLEAAGVVTWCDAPVLHHTGGADGVLGLAYMEKIQLGIDNEGIFINGHLSKKNIA